MCADSNLIYLEFKLILSIWLSCRLVLSHSLCDNDSSFNSLMVTPNGIRYLPSFRSIFILLIITSDNVYRWLKWISMQFRIDCSMNCRLRAFLTFFSRWMSLARHCERSTFILILLDCVFLMTAGVPSGGRLMGSEMIRSSTLWITDWKSIRQTFDGSESPRFLFELRILRNLTSFRRESPTILLLNQLILNIIF